MARYDIGQLRGAFAAGRKSRDEDTASGKNDPLVGKSFHAMKNGGPNMQGRIVGVLPDRYLVQFYSWIDGRETNKELVGVSEMADWQFYDSDKEMNDYYANHFVGNRW